LKKTKNPGGDQASMLAGKTKEHFTCWTWDFGAHKEKKGKTIPDPKNSPPQPRGLVAKVGGQTRRQQQSCWQGPKKVGPKKQAKHNSQKGGKKPQTAERCCKRNTQREAECGTLTGKNRSSENKKNKWNMKEKGIQLRSKGTKSGKGGGGKKKSWGGGVFFFFFPPERLRKTGDRAKKKRDGGGTLRGGTDFRTVKGGKKKTTAGEKRVRRHKGKVGGGRGVPTFREGGTGGGGYKRGMPYDGGVSLKQRKQKKTTRKFVGGWRGLYASWGSKGRKLGGGGP